MSVDEDEAFDFEKALWGIHVELQGLNEEAVVLAEKIAQNFVELAGSVNEGEIRIGYLFSRSHSSCAGRRGLEQDEISGNF